MSMADDNLVSRVLSEYGTSERFEPFALYNREGDCIEFYFDNDPSYAKRLDGSVTVFVSEDTGEIVGGMVKGVHTSLLDRFPGFRMFIDSGSAKIAILLSGPASTAEGELQRYYKPLIDKASDQDMSADLQPT